LTAPSVLFVTADPVGEEMGGNAIRALELGRAVASHATVTLAAPGRLPDPASDSIDHLPWDPADPRPLRSAVAAAEVVVLTPQSARVRSWARRSGARLVFDLYDPMPLEILELHGDASPMRSRLANTVALDHYLAALSDGDHFLCASERQRDLWVGALLAMRRITPALYARDRTLRDLIDVVPFGTPDDPPAGRGGTIRERFDTLQEGDEIVLWNGGLHAWLDPLTPIRAMPALLERRPRARLVFMGRPPPRCGEQGAARSALAEAERLGLLNRVVFFNDRWVPYNERAVWLLDAECTISTHVDHLETRFAFRTRLLDSFWAGLPVVCTAGDELAARVLRDDLGAAIPPGDSAAATAALDQILGRGKAAYADALGRTARDYAWSNVALPLVRLLAQPPPGRFPLRRMWRRSSQPGEVLRSLASRSVQTLRSHLPR
jgi:glycosyltransferase involved in cell wall biosynthesis